MAIELKMPALSPTMEKGTLAKWLVGAGDLVKPGDLLAEIETDKATMELEAECEGRVASLVVAAGTDDVAVGTVIALLQGADDTATASAEPSAADTAPLAAAAEPKVTPEPLASSMPEIVAPTFRRSPADRIRVSPLAQRIAEAKRIDLDGIEGTGPNGRIVRADLNVAPLISSPIAIPASLPVEPAAFLPPPADVPRESVKLSAMRKTIARRLGESKQTVPHFYLTARCNLDRLLALRRELNEALAPRGSKLSVNDMLMKAMALALVEVPEANVQFGGDEIHRFSRVDISMAVAIDGGLITPIIRDAASLSLSSIASISRQLAVKAREGKLVPDDYQGGTASISNLGMFGIDEMVPVINPPQSLILGVGAGVEQPWKVSEKIGLATIMAATASFDHRAIDGAAAAMFMQSFRHLTETPLRLVG